MRSSASHKLTTRTLAAVAAAVGALTLTAGPALAAPTGATAASGCTTTDIHLDPAAREVGWTVECTDRRYVFVDITIFAGGVAHSNPTEARWVDAGGTWQDLNVYPQTSPAIDHFCAHLVSYVDPTNPLEQPQVIGHSCI
ncbi:hypothetical protein [Saccharothrix syringae]|uniref:Secreted protein n=1 Tax=Saccharothrix syringae TaxID=103733 RepID=A0A5Q0H0J8_SACSY|nr:hypothetical protein [Saccharothrix syringae]QFZ19643.1 hypothetical protein EKG83_21385 [Saccharothrix syringae]